MKILYIVNATTTRGGANIVLLNLINELKARGCIEACVVCPDNRGIYKVFSDNGVRVASINYVPDVYQNLDSLRDAVRYFPRLLRRVIVNYRAVPQLLKLCQDFCPDIIHSNTSVIGVGFKVAKILGIPHVTHFREYGDLDFSMKVRNLDERLTLPNDYSICITRGIAMHHHVDSNPRNRVIYDGVINEAKMQEPNNKGEYFFYAGRITHLKGIDTLVKAYIDYARKSKYPVPLAIAGSIKGPYEQLYRKLYSELKCANLNDKVEWLGELDNADVCRQMKFALATVVPSHFEGFGLVMPEAISQGCVVIGRNSAGTEEQFNNGVEHTGNEIGFRFSSAEELAKVLSTISEMSPEELNQYVKRGQSTILEYYSISKSAFRIFEFYKEILNK